MANEITPIGSIHVSPRTIATIAYHAALQSYGVVGLTSKNLVNGLTQVLVKDPTHGISVEYDGSNINIDLYIIVEYGTRIKICCRQRHEYRSVPGRKSPGYVDQCRKCSCPWSANQQPRLTSCLKSSNSNLGV